MLEGKRVLRRIFACVSPVFAALATAAFLASAASATARGEATSTATVKRQSASTQYAHAEEQRVALNSKPSEKRSLADYKQVVTAYRRVALITSRAPEVPDSLLAIAELYTEMGDRFGRSYYQSAADSYQFLIHEYPSNKYCQDATLRMAKLQREQLGDSPLARKTYEDFLKRYPRSPKKREVQEALAELALLQDNNVPVAAEPAPKTVETSSDAPLAVEAPPAAASAHSGGKAASRPASAGIPHVRRIRAAANGDATRITIDLEDSVEYSSGRIANPDRIFFDLHAARLAPEVAHGNIHVEGNLVTAVRVAQNHNGVVRVVLDVNGVKDYTASLTNNPSRLLIDLYSSAAPPLRTAGNRKPGKSQANQDSNDSVANQQYSQIAGPKATLASAKPDLVHPASAPQPTRDGQATLTRTLGLKISRIVIDAGHGGHDTGTIGPTGLMEKDLCLDVALRLGKIIEQRLPGADVVYTRSDDTFVPLEERTNIANQAKADLFISIHANSSRDHAARGIETYYLNLKGSAEAMEVAARENSTSQEGVHDLQDLIQRIAKTEKIDESKEFAEDVQDSLAKRIQKASKPVKNRGVRKAPFVVLIGADMPSILTEISFLSNPADEQLLKKPEQRQRVAEGLYQGVASYLESMNSVTMNLPAKPPGEKQAQVPVQQSRNQK